LAAFIRTAYISFANGQSNGAFLSSAKISGGPAWVNSDRYQINAKAKGDPGTGVMNGPMLQALLEDRFKLKIHRETREVPVYELTVAKGGPKLQPYKEGSCTARTLPPAPLTPGQKFCGPSPLIRKGPNLTQEFHGVSLYEFSKLLDGTMDRPVINKTVVAGKFDFQLEFAPEEEIMPGSTRIGPLPGGPDAGVAPPVPASDLGGPSIFTAVQEQLGLKLQAAKGPGEFLVIDSVERPSDN
jgi:uncharacterized protein (TIGR03435 family)